MTLAGYIFSMATGGQLADLIGTKRLIAFSMTVCSLGTLAIPISANCHPYLVIAVRVLTGIAQVSGDFQMNSEY